MVVVENRSVTRFSLRENGKSALPETNSFAPEK